MRLSCLCPTVLVAARPPPPPPPPPHGGGGTLSRMITLEHIYILSGALIAAYAVLSLRQGTIGNAAFWGLLAASFLLGSHIGDFANGLIAIALVAVGGFGLMQKGALPTSSPEERRASAAAHGNWLFVPALI